jgi:hypothetical protein
VLIPRVFHQVWVGPDPFPDEFAAYQQTWLDHHPRWRLCFWTEDNLPDGLRRAEAYERLRSPVERCDILRFALLWRFGGVYLDTDFECLRSIEPLVEDTEFFTAYIETGRVNGALMGAIARHPLIDRALVEMQPREVFGYDKEAAGPLFFDRIVAGYPQATIFARELFYAKPGAGSEAAYAIHHNATAWKDAKVYRYEAAKWRASADKAWQKSDEWRLRARSAEAELARAEAAAGRNAATTARTFVAWLALALVLGAFGGLDGVRRFVADHNNFGDGNFLALAAAWLVLAAWAAARSFDALPARRRGIRKGWFVSALLLGALPYALMIGSHLGHLLNVGLLFFALVSALRPRPGGDLAGVSSQSGRWNHWLGSRASPFRSRRLPEPEELPR